MRAVRLLLVDDEPLILATFKQGLRLRGFDVITAACADDALAVAARTEFDLAILDIRMPGMSGLELGRFLRQTHDLHSVYLTAIGDDEFVSQAVQSGALSYAIKPIDIPKLVPVIEAAAARAKELNALQERTQHLDHALSVGRKTSMAIGIFMERLGLTEQAAFGMLRLEARRQRRKLENYCEELVSSRHTFFVPGARHDK